MSKQENSTGRQWDPLIWVLTSMRLSTFVMKRAGISLWLGLANGPGCHGFAATMLQKSWVGEAVLRYHVKSVCVRMESWQVNQSWKWNNSESKKSTTLSA